MKQLTIVGAGWAGLSAAVAATQLGWQVHLFEASHMAGGRARSLPQTFAGKPLDNGQHILIGAYRDTLTLMQTVGVDLDTVLQRSSLDLRFADDQGLHIPDWPTPLNLLAGIGRARGWTLKDKASLIQAAWHWQRSAFGCDHTWTVAQLCTSAKLTPCVMTQLIEPLCLSALNTPVETASALIFLRVLHDALMGGAGSSELLLPRVDLGTLFPNTCIQWLQAHGATVHLGTRFSANDMGALQNSLSENCVLLLACPAWEAARLTANIAPPWSSLCSELTHAAIATVYVHCRAPGFQGLPRPMMALHSQPNQPAQFVFDKGALSQQPGLLAVVVSACTTDRHTLEKQVHDQLRDQLKLTDLYTVQTMIEKRATLNCSPLPNRPAPIVTDHIWACGDYLCSPYPSTLEGAVRSGQQVVAQLDQIAHHQGGR